MSIENYEPFETRQGLHYRIYEQIHEQFDLVIILLCISSFIVNQNDICTSIHRVIYLSWQDIHQIFHSDRDSSCPETCPFVTGDNSHKIKQD